MKSRWKAADIERIREHLDNIEREVVQLRKAIIYGKIADSNKNQKAWDELLALSGEISERWSAPSAVEEIRSQREK